MGPFEGKKSRSAKKMKVAQYRKNARKSFWLKQGLEPVTAGFTVNRIKTVLTSTRERVKSGTYTMRSVV